MLPVITGHLNIEQSRMLLVFGYSKVHSNYNSNRTGLGFWPGPGRPYFGRDQDLAGAGIWPFWDFGLGWGRDYRKKCKNMMIFESSKNVP